MRIAWRAALAVLLLTLTPQGVLAEDKEDHPEFEKPDDKGDPGDEGPEDPGDFEPGGGGGDKPPHERVSYSFDASSVFAAAASLRAISSSFFLGSLLGSTLSAFSANPCLSNTTPAARNSALL